MSQLLRVRLSPEAASNPLARYAVRFVALSLGYRCEIAASGAAADLHYGERGPAGTMFVPYWPECYDPGEPHIGVRVEGKHWWVPERYADEKPADLIGGIARLLCLLDEHGVAETERGEGGVFAVPALPAPRRELHAIPVVDWHVAELGRQLATAGFDAGTREPRWPNGARYGVVLTHDTDAAGFHDVRELLRVFARAVRYRSPRILGLVAAAAWGWLRGAPDPFFQFAGWANLERSMGVRSAFYVHVRDGRRQHIHDPTYSVGHHQRWRILSTLTEQGFEVGVHAAIGAGHSVARLARERQLLEALVEHPVHGLRHHYWRLDWRAPWRTFRYQRAAGYAYDTSMAWRDRLGFRAGTSQPYQPLDQDLGSVIRILELPTSAMDGHVFEHMRMSPPEATAAIRRIAETVRDAGGLLNLNWHQETFGNRQANDGWLDTYREVVRTLVDDPQAWIATPMEVAEWWASRAGRLGYDRTESTSKDLHTEGP